MWALHTWSPGPLQEAPLCKSLAGPPRQAVQDQMQAMHSKIHDEMSCSLSQIEVETLGRLGALLMPGMPGMPGMLGILRMLGLGPWLRGPWALAERALAPDCQGKIRSAEEALTRRISSTGADLKAR